MAGLVPAIHVLLCRSIKTWMPGTRPGMTEVAARLALRDCREGVFADLDFVMLAAMRAADVEGDKAQSGFA
jgi:hypothetical protein